MTLPAKETSEKTSLADLFDLPSDAPDSVWSEPEDAHYAPGHQFHVAAAPPATTPAEASEVAEIAPTEGARRIRPLSWLWIGLGVLAAASVVALTIPFSSHGEPATNGEKTAVPAEHAAAPLAEPAGVETAVAPRGPAVPTDHSALVAARAALRAAETDLIAGHHAAVRARLGRLLLAIDAVESLERENVHAAAALLVARSLQAEADTARRAAR